MKSVQVTFVFAILTVVAFGLTSCGSKITTVNVRGRVTFENKPVSGAEVRFASPQGESTTTTSLDGNYSLAVKGDKNDTLQIKVLWPGFEHDEIKFKTYQAADKPIDIPLRKVFTGKTIPGNSNQPASNTNN